MSSHSHAFETGGSEDRAFARTTSIVGRDAELRVLDDIVRSQSSGLGAVVAIDGEAGIGKTTLLGALASRSRTADATVVWVRCTETDRIRPFGAVLDALDCRLQHPEPAFRRVAEVMIAGTELVVDPFRLDSDAAWRRPVQEAIVDLLSEILDRGAVLFAVDDLQWADAGTAAVLVAIARRTISAPLVVAWAQRTSIRSETADHLRVRFRDRLWHLAVGPLDGPTVEMFGTNLLGRPLDQSESMRLRTAEGNPFFVTALIANDGIASRTDVVGQWLDRLQPDTAHLVATASLLGGEFTVAVLGRVVQREVDEMVRALAPAVEVGVLVLVGSGRYAFVHDLIRTAAEASIPTSLQAALHREIAVVLESVGATKAAVARHLARGARPGDSAAAERIRAGCESLMRVDALSAAQLLEVAAGLCTPGSVAWSEIMADWVLALQWAGRARESLDLANAALARPLAPMISPRLRMVQATSLGLMNDLPAAAVAYRSVADDPNTSPKVRALVLAEIATLQAWGMDRSAGRRTANEALIMARKAGTMQAELQTLCAMSTMSLFDGEVADGVAHAREAVTRGRTFTSLVPAREVYLGLALANADQHDEAKIWFRKGQVEAEAVSDLWLVSRFQLARMSADVLTGEWESVIADAEAVIALHDDTGMGTGMPQAPAAAGVVAIQRGSPDAVINRYRELAGRHAKDGAELPGLMFTAWMEGLIAERDGRLDDASGIFTYLHETVIGNARLVQVWLAPDVVRVLLAAGDRSRAAVVAAEMETFARDVVQVPSAYGTAELCAGLVARAAGDEGRSRDMFELAAVHLRTAHRLPALLQTLDALPRSASVLAERAKIAQRLGLLQPESTSMPVVAGSPVERLTRTERAIAALIAIGLANPAIAAELGLSKRTVEYHVSNIYMKLAVTSRVAVARLMDNLRFGPSAR